MTRENTELIRKQMMAKIDITDSFEVEKVNRYCELLNMSEELQEYIDRRGQIIELLTSNGPKISPNPAVNQKLKVSKELVSVERSINFLEKKERKMVAMMPLLHVEETKQEEEK